jgi:hypothetical protein
MIYIYDLMAGTYEKILRKVICNLNITDRCLAILSHKMKINIREAITEIIDPNLEIKFQPA